MLAEAKLFHVLLPLNKSDELHGLLGMPCSRGNDKNIGFCGGHGGTGMLRFLRKSGRPVLEIGRGIVLDKIIHPNPLHDHGDFSIKEGVIG